MVDWLHPSQLKYFVKKTNIFTIDVQIKLIGFDAVLKSKDPFDLLRVTMSKYNTTQFGNNLEPTLNTSGIESLLRRLDHAPFLFIYLFFLGANLIQIYAFISVRYII